MKNNVKILSFVNQKGGCGKTTSAVNLAYALSNNHRVLLIDMDPQAHATFLLGITSSSTTSDLFEAVINGQVVNFSDLAHKRTDNLSVLASSIGLSAIENTLASQEGNLTILTKSLDNSLQDFNYCIIDCPPNLGILTLNALIASDYAIVPVGICNLSLQGVKNLNTIIDMLSKHYKKIPTLLYLIAQLNRRFLFSKIFLEKAKEMLGESLLSTMIRTNIHLREAASVGKSIYEYKKDARSAQDYLQLAEEIDKIVSSESPLPEETIKNHIAANPGVSLFFKGESFNEVFLVGEFNQWRKDINFKLKKLDLDTWSITVPLKKGTYRYKFIADDRWINDPANPLEENDDFGGKNSLLFVR